MLIRFKGPSVIRRTVGPYEWGVHNDFLQDVPADMAADLLTMPGDAFTVDQEHEPLALAAPIPVTDADFAALAMAGVACAIDLATLTEEGLTHVSLSAGMDPALVAEWASRARSYLFPVDEEE
jgi:hypothetical protein